MSNINLNSKNSLKRIPFLFLVILFIYFGCSNWKENPVQVSKTPTNTENGEYWKKYNIPQNVKKLLPFSTNICFAGTTDGKIYVSYDDGINWYSNTIFTDNKSINCFLYKKNEYTALAKYWCIAGTDQGFYYSIDNGISWQESTTNKIANTDITVNSIIYYSGPYLYACGKDNRTNPSRYYNYFSSSDFGKTWYPDTVMNLPKRNLTTMIRQQNTGSTVFGIDDEQGSAIYNLAGLFTLPNGVRLNSLVMTIDGTIIAGTNSGILREVINGKNWPKSGLDNLNVKSLVLTAYDVVIAATSDGLYASYNKGLSWIRIYEANSSSFELLSINPSDYIFVKETSGDWYTAQIPTSTNFTLFVPLLYSPATSSILTDKVQTLKWIEYSDNRMYWYNVQLSTDSLFKKDILIDQKWFLNSSIKTPELKSNSKYYWRVRTHYIFASSQWSETWSYEIK